MKKTLFLSLLLFCAFLVQVQAQSYTPTPDSVFQRLKWEIGTDVLWIVKKNTLPYSLFLRVHQKDNTAYRFRVGGDYTQHTNPVDSVKSWGNTAMNKERLNLYVSAGEEWQKDYNQLRALYGVDAFASYALTRSEFNVVNFDTFLPNEKEFAVGFSPFIGLQYFISPNVSLSTEMHLEIAYHQDKKRTLDRDMLPDVKEDVEDFKYLKLNYKPFTSINLSFHF